MKRSMCLALVGVVFLLLLRCSLLAQGMTKEEIGLAAKKADELRAQGKHAEAVSLYEKLLPSVEMLYGKESFAVANILMRQGTAMHSIGDFAKSEPILVRALEIQQAKLKEHTDTAFSLNLLGTTYFQLGEYAKAEVSYQRSLDIYEAKLGKDDTWVSVVLNNLANVHERSSQFAQAAALYQRSLQIWEAKEGKDTKPGTTILQNLAQAYASAGEYAKAEPLFLRVLKIREASPGKSRLDVAIVLQQLARLYLASGALSKGHAHLQRAVEICASELDQNDPRWIGLLHVHGSALRYRGEFGDAEKAYVRALKISELKYGEKSLTASNSNLNLGAFYRDTSRFAEAETQLQRALTIVEAKLGKDHPHVASVCLNMAKNFSAQGLSSKARPYAIRALQIYEKKLGSDHPLVGETLGTVGVNCRHMGEYNDAKFYLERSLKIFEVKSGNQSYNVAVASRALGDVMYGMKDYDKAESFLRRSLEILEASPGSSSELPGTLNTLASVCFHTGRYGDAELLHRRSLKVKSGFSRYNSHGNLAVTLLAQKKLDEAIAEYDKNRKSTVAYCASTLAHMSEKEQLAVLPNINFAHYHRALTLGLIAPKEAAAASAEWLVNSKAVVHESVAQQFTLIRDAQDPQTRELAEQLRKKRAWLAALVNRVPKAGFEAEYRKEMQELTASEQDLSEKLARAVGRPQRSNPWVNLNEVRAKLGAKTAFVDIARFPVFDFERHKFKAPRYVAWITPPQGKEDVQVIDLGEADAIDNLVEQMRKALLDSAKSITKVGEVEAWESLQKPLQALSAKVLHPLLPGLEKYDEWIVCPDGALWLTPWNALLLKDGKFAVESYLVRHVVSGRDLVLEVPKTKAKSAYIFADPDYDLSPSQVMKLAGIKVQGGGEDFRSTASSLGDLPKAPRLAGTAMEAEATRPQIERWLGQEPKIFLEGQASEAMIKPIRNPRVLALATHGYFLPNQIVESKDDADLDLRDSNRSAAVFDKKGQPIENPFLRCGLLLAGCNKRGEAKAGEDDGILTGLEIIGLNLQGCELVVLSACETGLGDVRNGEGVAGLRQAFQLAGAKAVMASLWQVPDRETAFLMNAFHGELAKHGRQAQALRQAQLQRIAARRDAFGAAHPFFWSAFALTTRGQD